MLLCFDTILWSIIGDAGLFVSSVGPLAPAPLSFRILTGNMGSRPWRHTLNLSHFVARQIRRRRGVCPLRCMAHRLQRGGLLRSLLVPMATIFDLLQTA